MVDTITPQNIDEVLNEVIKKLDEAEGILSNAGCSTDKVARLRCDALSALLKAKNEVTDTIHETYLLK